MSRIEEELLPTRHDPNCMGHYDRRHPLCVKHCGLRLRCAIEHEQNLRTELIEDLVGTDGELEKIQ